MNSDTCPCGSDKNYNECCGRFIALKQLPKTPEELMRSRYSAFVLNDMGYIERTMKSPAFDRFQADSSSSAQIKWLKLVVLKSSIQGAKGYVEFCAYYSENNKQYCLHELSEFKFEDGTWYYVDGKFQTDTPRKKS